MIDFLSQSIVVAPAAIAFQGRIHGQSYSGIDVWPSSQGTPTLLTAEYAFTPDPNLPYVAFFHTADAKPTLLYYDADGNGNTDKALDCIDATHYGAVVWTDGTKELIVNTAKKAGGFYLADINYQGTVDFASSLVGVTADPVTSVVSSDIRIDVNGHCSLLQQNNYYTTEVSVADDLSLTLEHYTVRTLYSSGAEFAYSDFSVGEGPLPQTDENPMETLFVVATLQCNYTPDTIPELTIQYGAEATTNTPPDAWTDYIPTDPTYDQPNMTITGSMLTYGNLPQVAYVWVRAKVVYGDKAFYSYAQRLKGSSEQWSIYHPEIPGYITSFYVSFTPFGAGVAISITGTRTLLYRVQFGPTGSVLGREIVKTYTAVSVTTDDPDPTSRVVRIAERDWADFWAEPTVIVSDVAYTDNDQNFIAFTSTVFADDSIGLAYDWGETPHLFVFTDAWAEITLPALPTGYTYSAIGPLVELPQPCFVVVVNGPDSTNGIGIYDITAGTWTMQCGSYSVTYEGYGTYTYGILSEFGSFNTNGTRLFFIHGQDGLWHCTSVTVQSNAVWFFGI
jgi:hypothetical protein